MNLFIAYVAFYSSLMGLDPPKVIEKKFDNRTAARVMVQGYKDDNLRYFYNETVIEADPSKVKKNPEYFARHEMCHVRFATDQHDKMFEYCMNVYKDRVNKRKQ